jgi:biopolymer transport protein TolR
VPKISAPPDANTGRRRGRRVTSSLSEINVVPLVDVMLVLLIIFMVAAPMMQKGIEVKLPVSRRADKMSATRPYITVPLSYRTSGKVFMDKEEVPKAVLPERMRQVMSTKDQKEVYLRGDGGVELQELMEVFDSLKSGGVERVGIVALPAPPRGRR